MPLAGGVPGDGRCAPNRLIADQHLGHRLGRADQARLRQLRQRIGQLTGVRLLIPVGRALQPGWILDLLLQVVRSHHPHARLGVVLVLRRARARVGVAAGSRTAPGRRRGLIRRCHRGGRRRLREHDASPHSGIGAIPR